MTVFWTVVVLIALVIVARYGYRRYTRGPRLRDSGLGGGRNAHQTRTEAQYRGDTWI